MLCPHCRKSLVPILTGDSQYDIVQNMILVALLSASQIMFCTFSNGQPVTCTSQEISPTLESVIDQMMPVVYWRVFPPLFSNRLTTIWVLARPKPDSIMW